MRASIVSQVKIFHNPRCSKSRQTLELIKQQGIEPEVIEYLKQPPSAIELEQVLKALHINAHQLLRVKEAEYNEHGLNLSSEHDQIIAAMTASPKLIERPIVINGDKARIGRPPESVLEIL